MEGPGAVLGLDAKGGQSQKRGVKAEQAGGAGESFPPVRVYREERFQGQVSCMLGRGQEQRTVEASTVRAEDEWMRRKKILGVEKPVQDGGLRGCLNLYFQLRLRSPTPPCPSVWLAEGSLLAPSLSAMPLPFALCSLAL